MYNEYYIDKKIQTLLNLISELQLDITSLEAKTLNEALLEKKYEGLKKYSKELTALINKYSDKIDSETVKVITANNDYLISTNLSVYKEAFEKGIITVQPIITSTNKAIIKKSIKQANTIIQNIIKQTKINSNKTVDSLIKNALKQLNNGISREKIIRQVSRDLFNKGITVKDSANREYNDLIGYTRRVVRDISNKCYVDSQEQLAIEIGIPNDKRMIEVSSHNGARPDHARWQGKVYKYNDFVRICQPNTPTGIMGINCRHLYFEFVKGVSSRIYKPFDLEANDKLYKLQQQQRGYERKIREYKRKSEIKSNLGLDNTQEKRKIKEYQEATRTLVKNNKELYRRYDLEQI